MSDSSRPALPDDALAFVREWLGDDWTAHALPGDVSVRAYYRVTRPDGSTYMLAYYPPEVREQVKRFLDAYAAVADHGRVPAVIRYSDFAVAQHDVGDRTLYDLLHDDRERGVQFYRDAIELLVAFQRARDAGVNAPFNGDFFANELEMTREFYIEQLMQMPSAESAALQPLFRQVAEAVARHPYVLCHRDYHGQNLHVVDDTLYVIDYQDLRMGPDTYDLASLLRDRGVARIIGDDAELALVDEYARLSGAEGDVRHRYFETLLQRSIKILGTFAKAPIVRGRLHYLDFIPPTIESIRRCLAELPEYAELAHRMPLEFSLDAARERVRTFAERSTS
jgi:aminoglycoside/choline kinase family phosphotransferase